MTDKRQKQAGIPFFAVYVVNNRFRFLLLLPTNVIKSSRSPLFARSFCNRYRRLRKIGIHKNTATDVKIVI